MFRKPKRKKQAGLRRKRAEDDEEDLDEGMNEKPLTAKEAKQLQREWLKSRYDTIRNGSDDEASHYENVKDQRYQKRNKR